MLTWLRVVRALTLTFVRKYTISGNGIGSGQKLYSRKLRFRVYVKYVLGEGGGITGKLLLAWAVVTIHLCSGFGTAESIAGE